MSAGTPCVEMMDRVTRYAHQDVTTEERARIAAHLDGCPSCRDLADFVSGFIEVGKRERQPVTDPHPDSSLIIAMEADELDDDAAKRVYAHIVRCDSCRNEYLFLRSVSEETVADRVKERLESLKNRIIDLLKRYDPGTILGPVRILAESPAFAFRGTAPTSAVSKLFEITVGGSVYSVTVGMSSDGSAWCDVAGTSGQEGSLAISFYDADGQKLLSSETDANGNGHFTLPRPARELIIINFQSQGAEEWVPIKLPSP